MSTNKTSILEFNHPTTPTNRTLYTTNKFSQKRILCLLLPLLLPSSQYIPVGIGISAFCYSVVGRVVNAAKADYYGMHH